MTITQFIVSFLYVAVLLVDFFNEFMKKKISVLDVAIRAFMVFAFIKIVEWF